MASDRLAHHVVLALGRLTFTALHTFEKLGVNMANVDETLASWTAWSEDVKAQLTEAKSVAETLQATDAAEDAEQAASLTNELAEKVQAAYETATAPPPVPDQSLPETPEPETPEPA